MKRILVFALTVSMLLTLCACGKKKTEEEKELIGAGIVNPVKEQTAESLVQATGIALAPPAGAEDVTYQSIDGETMLSQMNFTLDGKKYSYRAMPSVEYSDISGMYYEWKQNDATGVNGCIADIAWIDGAQGIITWFDVVPGIVYSLSVDSGASAELLASVANKVFVPVQGEVSGESSVAAITQAYAYPAGFEEIISEIQQNYHNGTAGSSLKAAARAAQLLDWFTDAGITAADLKQAIVVFASGLSGDDANEFPEQMDGILGAIKNVAAKDGASLLLDCGYQSLKYPWNESVVNELIAALS